ncbi:MAG: 4Fe-4S binding protein [Eubacteriales bacterium]|nr:4Fe-4S binding protein [Eubacteriales bacterium]
MGKKLNINTDLCMGCCACEIACKMENQLPAGIRYIVMKQTEDTIPMKEKLLFSFSVCQHCENPECIKICPAHAIEKRKDGIVVVNEEMCMGCKLCKDACPYDIPQFGEKNVMQKCNLCVNRLDIGLKPSCSLACPAGAITVD